MNGTQGCRKLESAQNANPPIGTEKKCSKCKREKLIDEFNKQKGGRFGVRSWCKLCRKIDYIASKEKRSVKRKEYYRANRDKIIKKASVYYRNNKEKRR